MRLFLVAILLTGCAHQITGYPLQPETITSVNRAVETVNLTVNWHDSFDSLEEACAALRGSRPLFTSYGCMKLEIKGGLVCTINAMPPEDFNDISRLAILGHEVAHCFLMQHE